MNLIKANNKMQIFDIIKENWEIVATIAATATTVVTFLWHKRTSIFKRAKVISYNFVDFVTDKETTTITDIQENIKKLSDIVSYELKPNGGNSFRDAVEETKNLVKQSVEQIKIQGFKIEAIVSEQEFLSDIDERGFFKMDTIGNCVVANIKISKIIGVSINQVINKEWWSLIHPADIEMLEKQWKFSYEKECDLYSIHRVINRDLQEIRTIEVKAKPYYINDKFIGFNGVAKLIKTEPLEDIHHSLSPDDTGERFWQDRQLNR